MTNAKHSVFIRDKKKKNPLPATPENIAADREAFSHYCVACHGLDGQNTGVPFAESCAVLQ
jgi:mono/diheme cytochrome c family protein